MTKVKTNSERQMDTLDLQVNRLIWDFVGDEHFEKTVCWQLHIHGRRSPPWPRWLLAPGNIPCNLPGSKEKALRFWRHMYVHIL